MNWKRLSCVLCFAALARTAAGETASINVQADKPGITVSPVLYGIFFEEINRAGDGGLYAEMVQNRSFEDATNAVAWTLLKGQMSLDKSTPLNPNNPTALHLNGSVANEGFHGMALEKGAKYDLSFYARGKGPVTVSLQTTNGVKLPEKKFSTTANWKKLTATLTANSSDPKARLVMTGDTTIDMVSLFPKNAKHKLRSDLMTKLTEMKPAFVRFPGGCFVEGDKLENAFRWKKTIGDDAARPGHWNLWNYRSTDGLGYHEYLQLCEDLGAEPLFVVNCGMSHVEQRMSDRNQKFMPDPEYLQDALDAIEYANGPATSKWGSVRSKAGHPTPFNLKYLEIGNENGGPLYDQRYALFHDAIKSNYPSMHLVANVWHGTPKSRPCEIIDEHYYNNPEFFFANANRYDSYKRNDRLVYVGEYAVTRGCGLGNLRAAVGEAAFMTGMERNSDVVVMGSYAPLFVNPPYKKWNPNAIVFDSARAYGTPSYYVQALFGQNRADVIVPAQVDSPPLHPSSESGMVGVGTWDTQAEFKDIKVTKGDGTLFESDFKAGTNGWIFGEGAWEIQDGALRQTSTNQPAGAFIGNKTWSDYTIRLKARKLGGREGFLISFYADNPSEHSWWNIGGWGNTEHAVEGGGFTSRRVRGKIETGRWYDIRIEISGKTMRCYLDDKLVHEIAPGQASPSLYAVAGLKRDTGELILKVVNASAQPMDTTLNLHGIEKISAGKAVVLTSADLKDENSFDNPTKVVPKEETVTGVSTNFIHQFPANSVTVLRFKP
jgi:alpha-L-arabinofuranosidase